MIVFKQIYDWCLDCANSSLVNKNNSRNYKSRRGCRATTAWTLVLSKHLSQDDCSNLSDKGDNSCYLHIHYHPQTLRNMHGCRKIMHLPKPLYVCIPKTIHIYIYAWYNIIHLLKHELKPKKMHVFLWMHTCMRHYTSRLYPQLLYMHVKLTNPINGQVRHMEVPHHHFNETQHR